MTTADHIRAVCDEVRELLLQKNINYGDAAINPIRCFSKADPEEAIRVRIDDKISRLMRGSAAGEDTELDLTGYLILLRVARRVQALGPILQGMKEAEEGKTHDLGSFVEHTVPDRGEGYRLLAPGEVVEKGDEYLNGVSEWIPAKRVGERVAPSSYYRRKLSAPEQPGRKNDPGEGYRLIERGEELRNGDEVGWNLEVNPHMKQDWGETSSCGIVGKDTEKDYVYRRKLVTPGRGERLESPVE